MTDEMLTITEARQRYHITRSSFDRLIVTGAIRLYDNPHDGRSRCVRVADMEQLMVPRRAPPLRRNRKSPQT